MTAVVDCGHYEDHTNDDDVNDDCDNDVDVNDDCDNDEDEC